MNAATRKNRRAEKGRKREDPIVISDDETTGAPAVKSAKRAAEAVPPPPPTHVIPLPVVAPPSPEVAELQEQVRQWEQKFQRLCRVAREYELRAERAENLLDSKIGIVDGVEKEQPQKRIDEMSAQLEAQRKENFDLNEKLEKARRVADTASRTVEIIRADLKRMNNSTSSQIEEMRRTIENGTRENYELKERVGFLTYQLDTERWRAYKGRMELHARNNELMDKLAEFGCPPQHLQQQQQLQQPRIAGGGEQRRPLYPQWEMMGNRPASAGPRL